MKKLCQPSSLSPPFSSFSLPSYKIYIKIHAKIELASGEGLGRGGFLKSELRLA